MYPFIKSILFRLDPENAHALTLGLLRIAGAVPFLRWYLNWIYNVPYKPTQAFGLNYINPIGLAAGYDKDGLGWRGLACLGFGHIEIGTVTPLPQPGNPKPRIFRLPEEQALINRMGFPGQGSESVARRMKGRRPAGLILGINIGKNKDTPLEEAARDYIYLVGQFASLADYLTINVSSPNTVGLRKLQARQALDDLLGTISTERHKQVEVLNRNVPMLVKLSPDLSDAELEDALDVIMRRGMDGVIATNTTLSRQGIRSTNAENMRAAQESGGLSGAPLHTMSLEMVRKINRWTNGALPIIGAGGVNDKTGFQAMLEAGASLVQVYTGLIYRGPSFVKMLLSQ